MKQLRGHSLDRSYVKSEFLKENPRFTSINQIKANDKIEARRKVNLTDGVHEQKDEVTSPGLSYIHNPKIINKTSLVEHRRA